ncbi:MAG: hypothetical protein K2X27_25640 [Candidatus Obscuribacterales bacterium]|nr:hypothetical protein [Candidatus Obscuribacterales bacterium]
MQTRCPFADCLHIFPLAEEKEFKISSCPQCSRSFTARTLARHLEIDKQAAKHKEQKTDAESFFASNESSGKMLVLLEEIRSLWNVGSIFRSADGAGFSQLFLTGITGCPPRKEIAKTSLGAEDHVAWNYSANSLPVLDELKKRGYQIIGLEKTENSKPLKKAQAENKIRNPLCLVLGSEVKGVYSETLAACDLLLDLPMRGFKESLNVAVAFGIAAYAIAEKIESAGT